jgi:hypothetical protein
LRKTAVGFVVFDDDDDNDDDNNNNNNTLKARNLGTAKNSHIGHCTCAAESANVKIQNIFNGRHNITCSTDCKYRTATTLYTVETWFVLGM